MSDIYNFLTINNSLSTSGQPTESQLKALAENDVKIIINLALHDDPKYSLTDEMGFVKSLNMEYIHIPVQFDAPGENDLLAFFHAMEKYQNRKIHIHCAANMRVTAFLGLYLMIKQGYSEYNAFESMRVVWQPNKLWSLFISDMISKYCSQTDS